MVVGLLWILSEGKFSSYFRRVRADTATVVLGCSVLDVDRACV